MLFTFHDLAASLRKPVYCLPWIAQPPADMYVPLQKCINAEFLGIFAQKTKVAQKLRPIGSPV